LVGEQSVNAIAVAVEAVRIERISGTHNADIGVDLRVRIDLRVQLRRIDRRVTKSRITDTAIQRWRVIIATGADEQKSRTRDRRGQRRREGHTKWTKRQ